MIEYLQRLPDYDNVNNLTDAEKEKRYWRRVSSAVGVYNPTNDIFDRQSAFDFDAILKDWRSRTLLSRGLILIIGGAVLVSVAAMIAHFLQSEFGLPVNWLPQPLLKLSASVHLTCLSVTASLIFYIGLSQWINGRLRLSLDELSIDLSDEYEKLHFSKQIYPGRGQLEFSYGDQGFLVSSDGLNLYFDWDLITDFEFFDEEKQQLYSSTPGGSVARIVSDIDTWIDDAHYMLLFLKETMSLTEYTEKYNTFLEYSAIDPKKRKPHQVPIDPGPWREYLVIPRHFFLHRRGADNWADFTIELAEKI